MFRGGGFGVGLTVNQLDVAPWPAPFGAPELGEHPVRLGGLMPVAARTDAELAEEMRRAGIAESRLWAYRVELVASLAARRGRERDCPRDRRGAASAGWRTPSHVLEGCSEFLPDELAMIVNCSRAEATRLAEVALTLVHRLPRRGRRWPTGS